MWADYTYYTTEYEGSLLTADNFNHYSKRAEDYIEYLTMGKVTKVMNYQTPHLLKVDKIKRAVCAVSDVLFNMDKAIMDSNEAVANATQGIASETVESHSVSFSKVKDFKTESELSAEFNQLMTSTATRILLPTGLLNRGVR